MKLPHKTTIVLAAAVLLALGGLLAYRQWMAPTRVAFANYPEYILAPLLDQELGNFILPEAVAWNEKSGDELKNYDAVIFFGMGLKFTERQELLLRELDRRKIPLYVTASTREETKLNTLTQQQLETIAGYLRGGGRENTRRMLNYIRREIDGKRFFIDAVLPPEPVKNYQFFHIGDKARFETFDEYMTYYRASGFFKPGRPTAWIVSGNGGGDLEKLIGALEKRDINVVTAFGGRSLSERFETIKPDLIIYQPHGRLSMGQPDATLDLLKKFNIPLLCPIKAGQPYEEYLKDQRGMTGGMLSQSVTMPELDGGVVPFVLSALFRNQRGLLEFQIIPDRLERFADLTRNMLELKKKANADKKIAIIYYKGPGKNALVAGSLEVGDSILNTLKNLQKAGYTTGPLPETPAELMKEIQDHASIFGTYAEGAIADYHQRARVDLVSPEDYLEWVKKSMPADLYQTVLEKYGSLTDNPYMAVKRDGKSHLALPRLQFGNIVIMPQSLPGIGEDSNKLIHGVKHAPPHTYIATYLWIRHGFQADALMHFGTHGSLEFTPWKQVALSSYDWPDVLIGEIPHFYLYVINNIGEAQIAKRRSYATMISHLTAPFMLSDSYGPIDELKDKLDKLDLAENPALESEYKKEIMALVKREKIDEELKLSSDFAKGILSDADLELIHNHVHELSHSKVNRGMYVIGRPYSAEEASETAKLMTVDALAAKRFDTDLKSGKVTEKDRDDNVLFQRNYIDPAGKEIVDALADPEGPAKLRSEKVRQENIAKMRSVMRGRGGSEAQSGAMPPAMAEALKSMNQNGAAAIPAGMAERMQGAASANKIETTGLIAVEARIALVESTQAELDAMINAFGGGYLLPSPGGDPVVNPATVPTGRNLVGIDPERTPTRESYAIGCKLADALIADKIKNTGDYPKKVAFSLWGGEFIRSQGTNIGEILYLLGVEPVWDSRGRVLDVRLIPMSRLKRPRIDVIVQTSGQFRGAATSRISLMDKAVRLAAEARNEEFANYVAEGSGSAVDAMVKEGMAPDQAKKFANARIFGGVNGNFGAGITGMVQRSDRWEDTGDIAKTYMNNMGALYTDGHWGEHVPGVFRAALTNTDTVVHPRSSNSWGPLSLDHVYEFMGGINLSVKNVTGKEPDGYFNDLRTPGRPKVQSAEQAVMVEARTTVLNPKYIKEMMEEGPSAAGAFAEVFRNTFGWEVMKPDLVKDHLWNEYKKVYIDDSLNLDVRKYFEEKNPYALQEMTAVMLEATRKGFWQPSEATVRQVARLHAELVKDHGAGCSGFVCNNAKLRDLIESQLEGVQKTAYSDAIRKATERPAAVADDGANKEEVQGLKLKEQKPEKEITELLKDNVMALSLIGGVIAIAVGAMLLGNLLRKREE